MLRDVCLALCIVALLQGHVIGNTINTIPLASENDINLSGGGGGGGPNININEEGGLAMVLKTLEGLQAENDQLRQDLQQSTSQLMGLVQALQEDNRQLWQQLNSSQTMIAEVMSEMSRQMWENLQQANQQVQSQVSDLVTIVDQVESQQEEVMEQTGMMQGVTGMVQQFEKGINNFTLLLDHLTDRMTSAEASLLQLQVEGCGCPEQLTTMQHKVDTLESLMVNLLHKPTSLIPSTSSATLPSSAPSSTPPTTARSVATDGYIWPDTPSKTYFPYWMRTSSSSPLPSSTTPLPPTTTRGTHQLQFTVPPSIMSGGDSLVTSILVTRGEKLLFGDHHDHKVMMSSLERPERVESTISLQRPWAMLQLQDGTIAVTLADQYRIAVLNITSDGLNLMKYINTERNYGGITHGPDNSLIVSKWKENVFASIDVINMEGEIQRTLLRDVDFLINPYCLKRFGDDVYVSDWTSHRVFRINIQTGEAKFTVGDLDLFDLAFKQPRKFDIDDNGNLYIATGGRICNPNSDGYFCIVQVTQSGSWKVMEDYVGQNGGGYPYGLELTPSQIIISWGRWDWAGWASELTAYSLPEPQEGNPDQTELLPDSKPCGLTNVALNKPAIQSTYHGLYGNPERVVDGFKGTNIAQCTHTADEDNNPNRWWRVDLMGQFEVHAVVITNRGDCCGNRLSDFGVYVTSTLSDPWESEHDPSDLCVHHSGQIGQGATVRLQCSQPITGQYVSLVLPTDSEPLNFCEMEVLGKPASEDVPQPADTVDGCSDSSVLTNVALNKPAIQSTYHELYGNPEKAVDGVSDTSISECTHTADEDSNPNRWWRVDLMGQFEVHAVVITNRGDCCGNRLSDFDVYVMSTLSDPRESEHDPSDLCVHHSGQIGQGATVRLQCSQPITGQYVSLVLPTNSEPLNFCEMEVLGKPALGNEEKWTSETVTSIPSTSPAYSSQSSTDGYKYESEEDVGGTADTVTDYYYHFDSDYSFDWDLY